MNNWIELPSLESLVLGNPDILSNNFYDASLQLKGRIKMNSISYLDFPSLAEVTVGKGSFQNATDSRFESISDYSVILIIRSS